MTRENEKEFKTVQAWSGQDRITLKMGQLDEMKDLAYDKGLRQGRREYQDLFQENAQLKAEIELMSKELGELRGLVHDAVRDTGMDQ